MQLADSSACTCAVVPAATRAVLPPGKFMSQGLVRLCPQGFYREHYVPFDAANGTVCTPCRPGITTEGAGAGSPTLCSRVIPGHGIAAVNNVTGPQNIPALPSNLNSGGLPQAYVCDFGYYSLSGYCAQCPSATATRARGAETIEECSECHFAAVWSERDCLEGFQCQRGPCLLDTGYVGICVTAPQQQQDSASPPVYLAGSTPAAARRSITCSTPCRQLVRQAQVGCRTQPSQRIVKKMRKCI
jgi:hypothetical protein